MLNTVRKEGYRYIDTVKFMTNPTRVINNTLAIDCCNLQTVVISVVYIISFHGTREGTSLLFASVKHPASESYKTLNANAKSAEFNMMKKRSSITSFSLCFGDRIPIAFPKYSSYH
jgi:hypothetical protein